MHDHKGLAKPISTGCGTIPLILLLVCLSGAAVGAEEPAEKSDGKQTQIHGQVIGPQGEPVPGADVLVIAVGGRLAAATESDADGNFQVAFSQSAIESPPNMKDSSYSTLVARRQGYGPGWITLSELEADPRPVLRLVEDVPIRGRILDLEGRPVAGAKLELYYVYGNDDQNLDGFLKWSRDHPAQVWRYPSNHMRYFSSQALLFSSDDAPGEETDDLTVTTDQEGRFELKGIGRERIARLGLSGPDIASSMFTVVTRPEIAAKWTPGQPSRETRLMLDSGASQEAVYPATFFHFAGPSRPITGTVRDRETGDPLQGIGVSGQIRGHNNHAYDKTDELGRYELTGLMPEGTLRLYAVPEEDMPYLSAEREGIAITAAAPPNEAETDFELVRGVLVKGRLVDANTEEPVDGWIEYYVHQDNPFVQKLPAGLSPYTRVFSKSGRFQITVLPGPGFLGSRAEKDRYTAATEKDFGRPFTSRINGGYWTANRGLVTPDEFHVVEPVDPEAGSEAITLELKFRSGRPVAGKLVDPDGQPVKGVEAKGLSPVSFSDELHGADFTVTGIRNGEERRVIFRHEERQLGAIVTFSGDEQEPTTITLRPFATLTGRVVDEEGHPIPGAFLVIRSEGAGEWIRTRETTRERPTGKMPAKLTAGAEAGRSDGDGRFRVADVIPGIRGELLLGPPDARERDALPVTAATFTLRAGEVRDLGDLTLASPASGNDQEDGR